MALAGDLKWVAGRLKQLDPGAQEYQKGLERLARRTAARIRESGGVQAALKLARALWESGDAVRRKVAILLLRRFATKVPQDAWQDFKRWIEEASEPELRDAISEWLIGNLVTVDRAWLRVLRHWTEMASGPLRRAGVLGAMLRVRSMADVDAALMIAEPLMRNRDRRIQQAVKSLLSPPR